MGEREDVLGDLRERARYYATLSSIGVPRPARAVDPPAPAPVFRSTAAAPPASARTASLVITDGPTDLAGVRDWIGDCQRCKLHSGRKTIVFGQGNPKAELMFVGEAPGSDEDEQGLAFVGKAGQLLTKIIEAIDMKRDDVFIANVIKCRPPQNRNPEPDEIMSCQPFLERQIAVIRPKVLVGLGKFAGQWLLKTAEPISKIRGRIGDYQGIKAIPTWHPAYLLRTPTAKKDVWEDMKLVRSLLRDGRG